MMKKLSYNSVCEKHDLWQSSSEDLDYKRMYREHLLEKHNMRKYPTMIFDTNVILIFSAHYANTEPLPRL